MANLLLKSYPDGTASVSQKRKKMPLKGSTRCPWTPLAAARREALKALGGQELASLLGVKLGDRGGPPLSCQVIQKSVDSQNDRPVGLTKRGGKMLRRAFASWETVTMPGTMAFGTLTMSDAAIEAIASQGTCEPWQAYQACVSRFMERLRKLLKSRGLPGDVIWVTEMHPSRSQRAGKFIPHVHFVAQTAVRKYQWMVKPSEIEELWMSAIYAHTNVDEKHELRSRCEIKCVKKSVARYVAKYLRKSVSCAIVESQELDKSMVPARWYAIANELHRLVRKQTAVISGDDATAIFDWLKEPDNPVVKSCGDIELMGDSGRPIWLASWFVLRCRMDSDALRLMAGLS